MYIELENDIYETKLELIQIETTGYCNMHCKHCRASNQPHKMITKEQMHKILSFAKKVQANDFKLTFSGGEPFLNKNLFDYLVMAKENGFKKIVITTNASLITDEWLEKLNDLKLDFLCIQVSIDSLDEKIHDSFRGYPGAFKKCCEVLDKIQKYDHIYSSIRMTITPKTLPQIEDMVKFALDKKCKILGIGSVIPFGRASDGKLSLNPDQKREFLSIIQDQFQKNKGKLEVVTEDPLKFLLQHEKDYDNLSVDLTNDCVFGGCTAGISSININSDGIITPCSMMEDVVLDINECKEADEMIKKYEESEIIKKLFSKKYSGKCGSCKLKRICGGCRASAKARSGDIMGPDLSCWRQ